MGWRLPPDPALPEAKDLLDGDGRALVAGFLLTSGWTPGAVDPVQVLYRPARSLTVRFDVKARRGDGPVEVLMVAVECRTGDPVRVWAFPDDPGLPGLPAAAVRPTDVLRYRPRRRAVLRCRLPAGGVRYTKVLPPARARRALRAAQALDPDSRPGLRLALPAAGTAPGAVRLAPVGGRSLREHLMAGDPLPSPARLAALFDDLAAMAGGSGAPALPDSPVRARLETAGEAAGLTGQLLPDLIPQLDKLVESVAHGLDWDPGDRRPVHGDLYEAQILVAGDATLGLLDLDGLGMGDPLLDAATFSAHLLVLALGHPGAASRILTYRQELRRALLEQLDAAEPALRWREAYAMLLLAPAPFRTLRPAWQAKLRKRVEVATELTRGS
ncbi:MAG: hypothetical protein ACRD0C_21595 [Acidimicrobiia bacterium]